jgi:hypothetical protein
MPKEYFFEVSTRKRGNPPREMGSKGFRKHQQANDAANEAVIILEADNYTLKKLIVGSIGGPDGLVIHKDVRY